MFVDDIYKRLTQAICGGDRIISLNGLTSIAAKSCVLAQLYAETGKRFAVVTDTNADADAWAGDLAFWLEHYSAAGSEHTTEFEILNLPSFESDVYSGVSPHAETLERRALALWQLTESPPDILLTTSRSLISRVPASAEMIAAGVRLVRDADLPPEVLIEKLAASGYVREDPIANSGQFSIRGGIVDVWPPNIADPVRIEFFGDTVESLRSFDAETQLSTGQLNEVAIAPMREFAASPQDMRDWAFFAGERFADERFARNLRDRTDFAVVGETFGGWEFMLPLIKPLKGSIFDYLDDLVLVVDEPVAVEHTLTSLYDNLASKYKAVTDSGDVALEPKEMFLSAGELSDALSGRRRLEMRGLGRTDTATDEDFVLSESRQVGTLAAGRADPLFLFPTAEKAVEIEIQSRSSRKYQGAIADFAADIRQTAAVGTTLLVTQTPGMAERLEEILREYKIVLDAGSIKVGELSGGFEIPSFGIRTYDESDIFGEIIKSDGFQRPKTKAQRPKSRLGAFISDFRDLKPGDFVVHVDHGIGRFEGLQTIESQGAAREFMLLIYADNAKLFVPVERMDLVSRYSSGEATQPHLDRLGGLGWQKTKAKAKRAMRDMADELLKLYAERKLVRGHAFSPDAPWQHEFENAFPYELTPDQATAIEDVKTDMETPVPMDRLVIGDVGYGKTEVAMRAAFKAVMDGHQVAVLTPTTVLAYQHFESFSRRFAAFPAKIELLSRFRSNKVKKSVVA